GDASVTTARTATSTADVPSPCSTSSSATCWSAWLSGSAPLPGMSRSSWRATRAGSARDELATRGRPGSCARLRPDHLHQSGDAQGGQRRRGGALGAGRPVRALLLHAGGRVPAQGARGGGPLRLRGGQPVRAHGLEGGAQGGGGVDHRGAQSRERAMRWLCASMLVLVASGCAGSKLRARSASISKLIHAARAGGAVTCAPIELAMAESHNDFAGVDLD